MPRSNLQALPELLLPELSEIPELPKKEGRKSNIVYRTLIHLVVTSVIGLTIWTNFLAVEENSRVRGDALVYTQLAYNFLKFGKFAKKCPVTEHPCVTKTMVAETYREPVQPILYASLLNLNPSTRSMTWEEFFPERGQMNEVAHKTLRYLNFVFLLVTAVACLMLTLELTGSWVFSYIVLALVGTSPVLASSVSQFLTELPAAMLLSLTALLMVRSFKYRNLVSFLLSGVFLGLLALTKIVYSYFFVPFCIVFLLGTIWSAEGRRRLLGGFLLFCLGYSVLVGGWAFRNYVKIQEAKLVSRRGSLALGIRESFNNMSEKEWNAAFYVWNPSRTSKVFLHEQFPEGIDARFDRNNQQGFYRTGRSTSYSHVKEFGQESIDTSLRENIFERILARPLWHLKVSLPLSYRGMFSEGHLKFLWGGIVINKSILGPLLYFLALTLLVYSLGRRNPLTLLLVTAPLFSFVFHGLISNSLPRYGQPVVPLLYVIAAVTFYFCCPIRRSANEPRQARSKLLKM